MCVLSFAFGYLFSLLPIIKKQEVRSKNVFEKSTHIANIDGTPVTFGDLSTETTDILRSLERQKYETIKQKAKEYFLTSIFKSETPQEPTEKEVLEYDKQRNISTKDLSSQQLKDLTENYKIYHRYQVKNKAFDALEIVGKISWMIPINFLENQTNSPPSNGFNIYGENTKDSITVVANYHCPHCNSFLNRLDQ